MIIIKRQLIENVLYSLTACYEKGKSLSTKLYTLKNNTGSIVVPQHNTYYDCKWKILAQKNLRINLQAEYFQTSISFLHLVNNYFFFKTYMNNLPKATTDKVSVIERGFRETDRYCIFEDEKTCR